MIMTPLTTLMAGNDFLDFRYMMYLARNNAWVQIGNDLYHISISDIIEPIHANEQQASTNDVVTHLTLEEENDVKMAISKAATSACSTSPFISLPTRPELRYLDIIEGSYDNVHVSLGEHGHGCTIKINVENFDAYFAKKYLPSATATDYLAQHTALKAEAENEALQNAFWLAASSGDYKMLQTLFEEKPDFNFNENKNNNGHAVNIIQCMFESRQNNLPYHNGSNYEETFAILKQHGLDMNQANFMNICRSYDHRQPHFHFFQQKGDPRHATILEAIDKVYASSTSALTATV